jgi:hypothetical protein
MVHSRITVVTPDRRSVSGQVRGRRAPLVSCTASRRVQCLRSTSRRTFPHHASGQPDCQLSLFHILAENVIKTEHSTMNLYHTWLISNIRLLMHCWNGD